MSSFPNQVLAVELDVRDELGLWQSQDAAEMQAILESLPLYIWMTVEMSPLTQHPNDPSIIKELTTSVRDRQSATKLG